MFRTTTTTTSLVVRAFHLLPSTVPTRSLLFPPRTYPPPHHHHQWLSSATTRGTRGFIVSRWLSSSSSSSNTAPTNQGGDRKKKNKNKNNAKKAKKKSNKFTINPNVSQRNADLLSAAFDELARKEGFDASSAQYANHETFEDEDFDNSTDFFLDDNDDIDDNNDDDDDDEFLDFGLDESDPAAAASMDMDARIAAAKRDVDTGRVSVPDELDTFASRASFDDLEKLGFRREMNPFGNDETPRREAFELVPNPLSCPACGAPFQRKNEQRPGYLPPEKFELQMKMAKLREMQKLQEKANDQAANWSPEDEIEFLIQTADGDVNSNHWDETADIDIDAMAEEMGIDLVEMERAKKIICKRCHGLQNFGKVDEALRPGWSDEPLLSQEKFRELLRPLREKPAVIIALIDLFDFNGSVLPELDNIAGENPVLLAANKADLLPPKMGQHRAENWVRRELEYMGIQSIANVGGAVRLVSCKTGFGVASLLQKARAMADDMGCDVYVVGAANAGKSTLINFILEKNSKRTLEQQPLQKKRAGNANARKGAVTVSPLPGTTLEFIQIDIGDGKKLYDTPGLLVPGTLTQRLTPEELKIVVPKKEVEPITFRVASGKCVLVGGLAKIEIIGDTKPFLLTFYVANEIKLHPTDSLKADDFISKHVGTLLTPPLEPGPERMEQIGEFEEHILDIDGAGWKEAAADITLCGVGWVAVTGAGTAKVKVSVPKGIGIAVRPPLMPFDIWEVASKYTGGKAVRKVTTTRSGKKRKGVGRR